jgi:hypothetical protein
MISNEQVSCGGSLFITSSGDSLFGVCLRLVKSGSS